MQGQGSTSEPLYEAFEFEHGSSSTNLGLDQQGFQNDGSSISLRNQNLSAYTLSSRNSSMPSGSVAARQSVSLHDWMSVGPSASLQEVNQNSHSEFKIQSDWASSSTNRSEGVQGTQESQSQATNALPSEIDLNINHIDNLDSIQSLSQVSNLNEYTQNVGSVSQNVAIGSQVSGSRLYSLPQHHHASSSIFSGSHESSLRTIHNFHDNSGGQQGLLLGGRCSLHKRKGIELVSGQSSASGSSSNLNQGLDNRHEDLSTRLRIATRVMASDSHSFGNTAGNLEDFPRNSRMRINQPLPSDNSLSNNWPHGNNVNHANNWTIYQQTAPPVPSNQLLEPRLLGHHTNPPNVSTIPSLSSNTSPILRSGVSNSRVGGRSNPLPSPGERSAIEEPNLRINQRNNFIEHSMIYPPVNNRNLEQDPIDADLGNGTTVASGHASTSSQARSVFAAYQPPGNGSTSLLQRRSSFRRPIYASSSESRGQNVNLPPHQGHFSISPEVGRVPARIHLPSFMTVPPILPDGQNEGAPSIPLPVRHRRNSEMYMADLLRRVDHSFFEDVLLFDRAVLFGAAEFHDQHRELRLDVDNMSYEELLALEERIGNVSTGLDEEKVKKCLSERKFVPVASEASVQVEPCCICQEEYVEGEDLGQLDCSHDFHSACIKQWLVVKNLCPICKNTALTT